MEGTVFLFLIKITTNLFWNSVQKSYNLPHPQLQPLLTVVSSVQRGLLLKTRDGGWREDPGMEDGERTEDVVMDRREQAGARAWAGEPAEAPRGENHRKHPAEERLGVLLWRPQALG